MCFFLGSLAKSSYICSRIKPRLTIMIQNKTIKRHFSVQRTVVTLLMMLAMAVKAQTPYAVYCDNNNTFYFTYRSEVLTENGKFTPEGETGALTITALWSGTEVTASGNAPGWNNNTTVKGNTQTVVFEPSFAQVKPTTMKCWFYDFTALVDVLGTDYLDTSEATDMSYMFFWCQNLSTLDVSGFDTGKVTNMSSMFFTCSSLTALDVSGFDTGEVEDMQQMFSDCRGLTALDVSGIDTGNVKDMSEMFNGCRGLTTLDVSGFDTGKVTNMSSMFSGCGGLTALDVSGFDTGKVTNMSSMFFNCSSLTALDLSGFDTGEVENMSRMFSNCQKLLGIFIGDGWNTEKVDDGSQMFYYCKTIVGEDGTVYKSSEINYDKAHAGEGGYMRKTFPTLTLYDGGDNTDIIASATPGMPYKVTIEGRTIYADNYWNTICLPFDVSLKKGALTGFRARTLESATIEGNTLTLTFGNEVALLKAGTPYIIKSTNEFFDYVDNDYDWDNYDWDYDENPLGYEPYEVVPNPRFKASSITAAPSALTFADGAVTFCGTFNALAVPAGDKRMLFLGANNSLHYPSSTSTTNINAFRAYFQLADDIEAGEPINAVRTIVLNFGDGDGDSTGIASMSDVRSKMSDVWFDLSGRKLSGKSAKKGVYINNGKKVVIK